jgi:pre-mRNA cleavage complex 2 protein Pcf11
LIQDWIKSREVDTDQLHNADDGANGSGKASSAAAKEPKLQYLPVPENAPNSVCPVCQESFEMKWLDDAQEFVWMDAKKFGDRIYHATCYAEAYADGGAQVKRGTPEPVLGKRKAEVCCYF